MTCLSRWTKCAKPCLGRECEDYCVLGGGGAHEHQSECLPFIERCEGAVSLERLVVCITCVWICPGIFYLCGVTSRVGSDLQDFVNKTIWMHDSSTSLGCVFCVIIRVKKRDRMWGGSGTFLFDMSIVFPMWSGYHIARCIVFWASFRRGVETHVGHVARRDDGACAWSCLDLWDSIFG